MLTVAGRLEKKVLLLKNLSMDSEFASLQLTRVFQCEREGRDIAEFTSLGGLGVGQHDACNMDTNFTNSTCFIKYVAMNSKETKQFGVGTSPSSCFTLGPFCLDGALLLEASSFSFCLVPHCFVKV